MSFQEISRILLRTWARSMKAPGWCYQAIERWGSSVERGHMVSARLPNGFVIPCDLSDHVQRQIYFFGLYEAPEAYVFSRLLRPGMTVVDAGANVGQYSLLASAIVGPSGVVHAFEPVPSTREALLGNVRRNGVRNVMVHPFALWERRERLSIGLRSTMADNSGAFSVADGNLESAIRVEAVSLDELVDEGTIERVDAVKMDIEGAELHALRGMTGVLSRDRPVLLVEVRSDVSERMRHRPRQLWEEILAPLGYRALSIGHSAATCELLDHLDDDLNRNVLFFAGSALPAAILGGWDLETALRWSIGRPSSTHTHFGREPDPEE